MKLKGRNQSENVVDMRSGQTTWDWMNTILTIQKNAFARDLGLDGTPEDSIQDVSRNFTKSLNPNDFNTSFAQALDDATRAEKPLNLNPQTEDPNFLPQLLDALRIKGK